MTDTLKTMMRSVASSVKEAKDAVADKLAKPLIGVRRIFTVPGDFTLPLMHDMEQICGAGLTASPPLPFILGLNELNSGYSADAYARLHGFSVLMVTFSVGSLSAINAIAGMYAENVPCLVLVGSPNSNSPAEGEIVHHTLGETRYDYSLRMAKEVTAHSSMIVRARDTPRLLHEAVEACLIHRKPVYVEIASNLSSERIIAQDAAPGPPPPLPSPMSISDAALKSDPTTLAAALSEAVQLLNSSARPLVLGGSYLHLLQWAGVGEQGSSTPLARSTQGIAPLVALLDASGYAYAAMLDAKAIVSEWHPNFIGLYGGGVSLLPGHNGPGAGALVTSLVRSADVWLMCGVHLTDYSSAGHAMHPPATARLIEIFPRYVRVAGQTYHRVMMRDFLLQLASPQLTHNTAIVDDFNSRLVDVDSQKATPEATLRSAVEQKEADRGKKYPLNIEPYAQLTMRTVHHHLQRWITTSNAPTTAGSTSSTMGAATTASPAAAGIPPAPAHVLVDCGDSWFTGMKLRLPPHGSFAVQLQYGSLGWGTPAALGYSLGLADSGRQGRLVALIGDGAFQMSPQEVSTLLRYGQKPVLLLMNNSTYLVENEIVEGAMNDLVEFDYVALVQAMRGRGGRPAKLAEGEQKAVEVDSALLAVRAQTAGELEQALYQATSFDGLVFIEVVLGRDDCNDQLTEWAHSLHPSASRPPRV